MSNFVQLHELAGCINGCYEKADGTKLTHKEYWKRVIIALGYDEVKKCVPYTLEQVSKALERGDIHLNTLPILAWEEAGGFCMTPMLKRPVKGICQCCKQPILGEIKKSPYINDAPLNDLYRKARVNLRSVSDGVSLLKNCAIMMYEEATGKVIP